ncbi:hypothetical protein Cmtc_17450 [Cupriavidus sp. TKC]|uniref:DUF1254 domain-containing protein n=1 Tax=Cupriavidus sp. TKC TaxID=2880159 RepID=UPI0025A77E07|nr:DUF1254 domain-containing protein [Cupriavidus sp. TKC]GMG90525.1 hypothetical protein Cmtc_17450 [Cupriavidus sp. TKC]
MTTSNVSISNASPSVGIPVTVDNFVRAETDMYFSNLARRCGGVGKFHHNARLASGDERLVIRPNRDTLYSVAVFDLDAGPVTITLPDSGGRFMSMQVINQDHHIPVPVSYEAGTHKITREQAETRYVAVAIRLLADPARESDLDAARRLQALVAVRQAAVGSLELPDWDAASRASLRERLTALGAGLDSKAMFGRRKEVMPTRHLIGTAVAWGGNPERDATYVHVAPEHNDGETVYRLTVGDVPVDGFWSITVYAADGYFSRNACEAYSINSLTAHRAPDGSATIQFGGYDASVPNCLPIVAGWNYMVRLYRPRAEVLSGEWQFPLAIPRREEF